jgi:hypothetical protein
VHDPIDVSEWKKPIKLDTRYIVWNQKKIY